MNKIVKYDNKFNLTKLNNLNQVEQDIFMTICSGFSTKKVTKIQYDFSEIKENANFTNKKYTDERFREFMISTQKKIAKTVFTVIKEDGSVEILPMFTRFSTPAGSTVVNVELNPYFYNYLYDIPQKIPFTQFELTNFLALRSKYSKTLFRYLLQSYRGEWTIDFKEFIELLDFPKSYRTSVVIMTIIKMVSDINKTKIIDNLTYHLVKNPKKRGEPIESITFTYTINNRIKQELEESIVVEKIVHKETEVIPAENPLYNDQVVIKKKVEQIEHQAVCPRCNGKLMKGTVSTGANKGREYEACINSKYCNANNNTSCKYFNWLDTPPPVVKETVAEYNSKIDISTAIEEMKGMNLEEIKVFFDKNGWDLKDLFDFMELAKGKL